MERQQPLPAYVFAAVDAPPPPTSEPGNHSWFDRDLLPRDDRVLRRSTDDRMIAGLCGGLGRYLDVDPVLIRLGLVVLTLAAGVGLLFYLAGWLLVPLQQTGDQVGPAPRSAGMHSGQILGIFLLGAGIVLLMQRILPWFDGRYIWPLALVALGVLVLAKGGRQ
jgi:phage shock protein C